MRINDRMNDLINDLMILEENNKQMIRAINGKDFEYLDRLIKESDILTEKARLNCLTISNLINEFYK